VPPAKVERKIKYTADLRMIAEDFAKAEVGLKAAVKEANGFVANSEISGSPGSPRSGTWRVRVPVEHFNSFREAVLLLGEVERNTTDSEDVTEEYYDLQAHIKNRQAEEEALRQLLEKNANNMETFLAIRREMNQVRDDINRKQGRLKMLANLSDLTTIIVGIREKQKYLGDSPPETAETPTFAMRAGRTFTDSLQGLQMFGQFLALCAIGLAPWLPVLLAIVGVLWLAQRRSRAAQPTPPVAEQTAP
jgi:hypothetical protein